MIKDYHASSYAHELSRVGGTGIDRIGRAFNIEEDNRILDEYFQKNHICTRDFECDTIYRNDSNNLVNLKLDNVNWKVHLVEKEFMNYMWSRVGLI
jgi:hypothetical protein